MPKIDISPIKKTAPQLQSGIVRDLIKDEEKTMDIEDFLASVKAWEKALKREEEK